MTQTDQLTSSMEDYLEAILQLQEEHQVARAKEIGARLQVNRSSVTTALQALAKRGLVNYTPYEFITLTGKGQEAAREVAQRHAVLSEFLTKVLRIDHEAADQSACRLEHALSELVLERLVSFMEFVNRCPEGLADFTAAKGFTCPHHSTDVRCEKCGAKNDFVI